jgi:hypothetical protein
VKPTAARPLWTRAIGVLALVSWAVVACSDASPTVTGGEPLVADTCRSGGPNGGHRWQDMYACYFGPSGTASCGARSGCHGSASELGTKLSGFLCGTSADACWQGMMRSQIVPSGGTPDATQVHLLKVTLRKSDGTGTMPKSSSFVFQPEDLARISAWIQDDKAAND